MSPAEGGRDRAVTHATIVRRADERKLNVQFTKHFKEKIRAGAVSLSYRNWSAPRAKVGGVYKLHPSGGVRVTSLTQVAAGDIPAADAIDCGFDSASALRNFLAVSDDTLVYRVAFSFVPPSDMPTRAELPIDEVTAKLDKMEQRAEQPWAYHTLRLIADHPGTRAGDLAPHLGWDTPKFKTHVRRLKKLGLTESLEVGYRLSALGRQVVSGAANER